MIKLGTYKGIEVTITPVTYKQEDMDQQIQYLLNSHPVNESKDGLVEMGDTAVIDFEGFKDGVAFEGGKGESYPLGIGSHSFIPGFEEQLVGMAKGETRDIDVVFPEQYPAENLAGQPVVFKVTVHDITTSHTPEFNDEFVASLNIPDVTTCDGLKEYIGSYLQYQADKQTREAMEDAVMTKLLDAVEIDEYPQESIDLAIQQQVSRISFELQQQGMNLEQYLQMTQTSKETLQENLKEFAQKQVKLEMTLTKIAEEENIQVNEEEVNEQYELIAKNYQKTLEEVKQAITVSDMIRDLTRMKASQIVLQTAVINQAN